MKFHYQGPNDSSWHEGFLSKAKGKDPYVSEFSFYGEGVRCVALGRKMKAEDVVKWESDKPLVVITAWL